MSNIIGYLILTSFSIINHSFLLMNTSNRKCETDYPVTSWLPCPALLNIPDCTSNTLNGQLGRLPLACFPDIGPFANIMPVSNVMKMPSYHRQNVSSFIFLNWYIYIVVVWRKMFIRFYLLPIIEQYNIQSISCYVALTMYLSFNN